LRRGRAREDYKGEKAELQSEREKLEERRESWEKQVQKLQSALVEAKPAV
jgi:hypothetical protein